MKGKMKPYLLLIPLLALCGCTGLSRVARGVDGNNSTIEIDLNTPWGPQRLRSIPVVPLTNAILNLPVAQKAQMVMTARPAPPLPPGFSPLVAARTPAEEPIGKFICTSVSEVLRNEQKRDVLGIPTGEWDATKNWLVTLSPVPEDGTNKLWGAWRTHDIRLVSPVPVFTLGGIYELAPSTP